MLNKYIVRTILFIVLVSFIGCKKDTLPKPQSHLRLDYPIAEYTPFMGNCSYTFDVNTQAVVKDKGSCNFNVEYSNMKATVYLNYKPINNNINTLLRDAQKLTYEHVIKADDILEQPFQNTENKVYGMYYQVGGNAASQAQFYLTDSLSNFVVGSVYFYAKPNFDSIMPAASYIENDVKVLMESLRWK